MHPSPVTTGTPPPIPTVPKGRMVVITIPHLGHRESSQDGPWYRAEWIADHTQRSVTMKCPNGHIGSLDDHRIHDDGTVEPSVVCPRDGCDFRDAVVLADWNY